MLDIPARQILDEGPSFTTSFVSVQNGSPWAQLFPDRVGTKITVKEYFRGTSPSEALFASTFTHENIVKAFAVSVVGSAAPLGLYENYNLGSLKDVLLKRNRNELDDDLFPHLRKFGLLIRACLELLKGIEHIHATGIVHNNLTPASLLVNFDGKRLKIGITNFGKATRLVEGRAHEETLPWYASESKVNKFF